MSFELNPSKQTTVTLSNTSWVFITDVIRKLPYGVLVDAEQQNLATQMNSQIITANLAVIEQELDS